MACRSSVCHNHRESAQCLIVSRSINLYWLSSTPSSLHKPVIPTPCTLMLVSTCQSFFSPLLNMWVVTRHEDICEIARNTTHFSNGRAVDVVAQMPPEVLAILQGVMCSQTFLCRLFGLHIRVCGACPTKDSHRNACRHSSLAFENLQTNS